MLESVIEYLIQEFIDQYGSDFVTSNESTFSPEYNVIWSRFYWDENTSEDGSRPLSACRTPVWHSSTACETGWPSTHYKTSTTTETVAQVHNRGFHGGEDDYVILGFGVV
jgi:hypothetical protein